MLGIETEGLYPLMLNMQLQAVQVLVESTPPEVSFGVTSLSLFLGEKEVLQGESRISYGIFTPVREKQTMMQPEAVYE